MIQVAVFLLFNLHIRQLLELPFYVTSAIEYLIISISMCQCMSTIQICSCLLNTH